MQVLKVVLYALVATALIVYYLKYTAWTRRVSSGSASAWEVYRLQGRYCSPVGFLAELKGQECIPDSFFTKLRVIFFPWTYAVPESMAPWMLADVDGGLSSNVDEDPIDVIDQYVAQERTKMYLATIYNDGESSESSETVQRCDLPDAVKLIEKICSTTTTSSVTLSSVTKGRATISFYKKGKGLNATPVKILSIRAEPAELDILYLATSNYITSLLTNDLRTFSEDSHIQHYAEVPLENGGVEKYTMIRTQDEAVSIVQLFLKRHPKPTEWTYVRGSRPSLAIANFDSFENTREYHYFEGSAKDIAYLHNQLKSLQKNYNKEA